MNEAERLEIYSYNATVISIYDADTVRADISLGFGLKLENQSLRLFGIDAPEVRGEERPEGLLARDFLRSLMPEGTRFTLLTVKDKKGKYGRLLSTIYLPQEDGSLLNVNNLLLEQGFAEIYV